MIVDGRVGRATASIQACEGAAHYIEPVPDHTEIIYSCRTGEVGVWDIRRAVLTTLSHHAGEPSRLSASATGDRFYVGYTSGELIEYDTATKQELVHLGHLIRIDNIQPPTISFPYLLSRDFSGQIRVWQVTSPLRRLPVHLAAGPLHTYWTAANGPLIIESRGHLLIWDGRTATELPEHQPQHARVAMDSRRSRFAMFGDDGNLELWSIHDQPEVRTLHASGHPIVANSFSPDGLSVLLQLELGEVLQMDLADGTTRAIARLDASSGLRDCERSEQLGVFAPAQDWIWRNQRLHLIGELTTFRHATICTFDGVWIAEGFVDGAVWFRSTLTGWTFPVIAVGEPVRWLSVAPDSTELAAVTKNQVIVQSTPLARAAVLHEPPRSFRTRIIDAHYVVYSADGTWLTVQCDNGDVWFRRRADAYWIYRSVGGSASQPGSFSADSKQFAATNDSGSVFVFDMTDKAFTEASNVRS